VHTPQLCAWVHGSRWLAQDGWLPRTCQRGLELLGGLIKWIKQVGKFFQTIANTARATAKTFACCSAWLHGCAWGAQLGKVLRFSQRACSSSSVPGWNVSAGIEHSATCQVASMPHPLWHSGKHAMPIWGLNCTPAHLPTGEDAASPPAL